MYTLYSLSLATRKLFVLLAVYNHNTQKSDDTQTLVSHQHYHNKAPDQLRTTLKRQHITKNILAFHSII